VHVADVLAWGEQALGTGLVAPELDRLYLVELGLPPKAEIWRQALAKNQRSSIQSNTPQAPQRRGDPLSGAGQLGPSRMTKVVLVSGFCAVVLVGGIALNWSWQRGESPGPTPQPDTPIVARSGFKAVKLEGIFFRAGQPTAVINGNTLSKGEAWNGIKVVDIQPARVVLEYEGEQRAFQLR
jgi:hypothetical protein